MDDAHTPSHTSDARRASHVSQPARRARLFAHMFQGAAALRRFPVPSLPRIEWNEHTRSRALLAVEVLAVIIWAIVVTHPFLNMNPRAIPIGTEFSTAIQLHHIWLDALECGTCSLWYGQAEGGFPSFVDPISSVLHPLVIASTLLFGVVNGSKVALIATFAMAGIAQWWLGRVLGFGRVARLWGAFLVVVAGHLAGRLELGAFNMVLSTAACSLVIPPLIRVVQTASIRMAVVLGVVLALAVISGNGYLQVALAFCMLVVVVLLPWERAALLRVGRRLALAVGLALLLAAPFLVPYMHFLPNMAKDFDLEFRNAQPLAYVPLNLVIRDTAFYDIEALGTIPFPAHYIIYVGWIPLFFAMWGVFGARRSELRMIGFLLASMLMAFWLASGVPLRWLVNAMPVPSLAQFLGGVRFNAIMAGMGIPYLLALSAWGLDRVVRNHRLRYRLTLGGEETNMRAFRLDLRWLLVLPCILALNDAWSFSNRWIQTAWINAYVYEVVDALQTPDMQWVTVPLGQHFYVEPAIAGDLKLSVDFFRTWHWRDRPKPEPVLEANALGVSDFMEEREQVQGVYINRATSSETYAAVMHADGSRTPCHAYGTGGHIDVHCRLERGGVLTIREHSLTGWQAQMGEHTLHIDTNENWLTVDVLPGNRVVQFRYRPWDVWAGALLWLIGVGVAVAAWRWSRPDKPPKPPQARQTRPAAERVEVDIESTP